MSIALPSEDNNCRLDVEEKNADANSAEHKFLGYGDFVGVHYFIRRIWTMNRAATNTAAVMNMALKRRARIIRPLNTSRE